MSHQMGAASGISHCRRQVPLDRWANGPRSGDHQCACATWRMDIRPIDATLLAIAAGNAAIGVFITGTRAL